METGVPLFLISEPSNGYDFLGTDSNILAIEPAKSSKDVRAGSHGKSLDKFSMDT